MNERNKLARNSPTPRPPPLQPGRAATAVKRASKARKNWLTCGGKVENLRAAFSGLSPRVAARAAWGLLRRRGRTPRLTRQVVPPQIGYMPTGSRQIQRRAMQLPCLPNA